MRHKRMMLLIPLLATVSLFGCQQQDDIQRLQEKIQFVPNQDYVGDPQPVIKEEMKLTDEERKEFELLQKEILLKKEGE